jgi:NADP-dependent aldehyde dehydrogenase
MKNAHPHIIGYEDSLEGREFFAAISPLDGQTLPAHFCNATESEINTAAKLAAQAASGFRRKSTSERAVFLNEIAKYLEERSKEIIRICALETALPETRLQGEMGRTCNQLRMFADQITDESFLKEIHEEALPERVPPRPDLLRKFIGIGPVAVFGASNFPLAFSVAGGDTASALAAGCPVIVKGHPLHPYTSHLVGQCIRDAAKSTEMPNGVFSLLHGKSNRVGQQLLFHPAIKAGAFTGSQNGGRALLQVVRQRSVPIPFFAEMGSVNPMVIMRDSLEKNYEEIAAGILNSCTLGVGQFCTNPGLVIIEKSEVQDKFLAMIRDIVESLKPGPMLSEEIANNYMAAKRKIANRHIVKILGKAQAENKYAEGVPCVLACRAADLVETPEIAEEIFGPSTMLVLAETKEEILQVLDVIGGQLTATLFCEKENLNEQGELLDKMAEIAGRVLYNSYPTGVEVGLAMQHGGPWPASSDSRFTSVGAQAIFRFLRPVVWQNIY